MTREETAEICRVLSDSNRLHIIEILVTGEHCACSLNEKLNITQPTLSHHMKVLSDCKLVIFRKEGKWMHYSLNCPRFREFKEFIGSLECACSLRTDSQGTEPEKNKCCGTEGENKG